MRRPFKKHERPVARNCQFCNTKTEPDYKDPGTLGKYVTERGKLLPLTKTGLCRRHQRSVTREVKRARYLAMLPFVVRV